MSLGREVARELAAQRAGLSDTIDARCVDVDWAARLAVVNVGGAEQTMSWAGPAPWPGDRVRVMTLGQKPVAVVQHGAPIGTVSAASSTAATVLGDDGQTYVYPFRVGDAIAPGDRVRLDHAGRVVTLEYSEEPPGSDYTPPAPPPSQAVQARWFYPTDSANYRLGAYASSFAEVSANRSAFYWYGRQIASSIPDSATIVRARLSLAEVWDELPTVASRLGKHSSSSTSRTAAAPSLSGAIDGITGGGTVDISAFADDLKTGAAYGVGFYAGFGWRRFDAAARSGAIYIEWQ